MQALEGRLKDKMSPACWLQALWRGRVGKASASIFDRACSRSSAYVFDLPVENTAPNAPEAYRVKLQQALFIVGYAANFTGNHGIRAGFQVSAYIFHSKNPEYHHVDDIWGAIALVLGYSPEARGRNQLAYFKNNFRQVMMASRLIGQGSLADDVATQKIVGVGQIALNALTPELFHGIEFVEREGIECLWADVLNDEVGRLRREIYPGHRSTGRQVAMRLISEHCYDAYNEGNG